MTTPQSVEESLIALRHLINDINAVVGYKGDDEINTLCRRARRSLNTLTTHHEEEVRKAVEAEREKIRQWAYKRATRCAACFGHKGILHNHGQSDISDLLELLTPTTTKE